MAEPSVYDLSVDIVKEYGVLAKEELRKRFKRTKPFRQEVVPKKEQLQFYESLTGDDMDALIKEQGAPAVNSWIETMETEKKKQQGVI